MKYKCIICRRKVNSGRKINPGDRWVVCRTCGRKWSWSSRDRYFRARKGTGKWQHQNDLLASVKVVLRKEGCPSSRVYSEVGFPDWGVSRRGGMLRFDIAIPKLQLLIDYHGKQHYTPDNAYHRGNREKYNRQRENDELKVKLAPIHGWSYMVFSFMEAVEDEEWVRKRISALM